ncbi:MAG: ATP-dependent Clp protease proteolytic subunit [Firmicutes bacterium]|nr:ATP-dependent Clp protease proteolytic subunit [Candidatus Colivicinus equi]
MNNKKLETAYLDIAIPQNVENLQLPDPSLLQFYKNYDNRVLWIDSEISEYTLEYAKMIMQWNFEDKLNNIPVEKRKPIKIIFFSPGGDLEVNNCLVDTIQLSKTKVIGINAGEAASSGCFIYLACHDRYTFPTAQFLIHQGAGTFSGTYDIVVAAIMNYQRQIEELGDFVLSRTNIPENVFNENFSTDWYLSADDAIKYGVAHKVINSLDEIIGE